MKNDLDITLLRNLVIDAVLALQFPKTTSKRENERVIRGLKDCIREMDLAVFAKDAR